MAVLIVSILIIIIILLSRHVVAPGDTSTYQQTLTAYLNDTLASVPLPYIRPCGSLCIATGAPPASTTCAGVLTYIYAAFDCEQVDNRTFVFDFTSDPLAGGLSVASGEPMCNDLFSTQGAALVGASHEYYIGETCAGVVGTEVYIPSSDTISPFLAPFLPPYVIQVYLDGIVGALNGYVPRYLKEDCLISQREAYCNSYFLAPYPVDDLAFLFGTIYLPSFPHHSVCNNYMEKCEYLVTVLPEAALNCDEVTPSGIVKWPNTSQTILSLNLGAFVVDLISPPYEPVVTMELETQCPYGMVVPEDPSRSSILWIPDTGCALQCPSPVFSKQEWSYLYNQAAIDYTFCTCVLLLVMLNLFLLQKKKRNIFVINGAVFAFMTYFPKVLMLATVDNTSDMMCDTNASWHSRDNFYESSYSQWCGFIAVLNPILAFLALWSVIVSALEIWFLVVKGTKRIGDMRKLYVPITLAIIVANILVVMLYDDPVFVPKGSSGLFCKWGAVDNDVKFYTNTLPRILYFGLAMMLIGHSIVFCVQTTMKVVAGAKNPILKLWKAYSMLFLFFGIYLVIYPVTLAYFETYLVFEKADYYTNGSVDWIVCLITYYTSDEVNTSVEMCGKTPPVRTPLGVYTGLECIDFIVVILFLYITLHADVKAVYWNWFVNTLDFLHLKGLLSGVLGATTGRDHVLSVAVQKESVLSSSSVDSEKIHQANDKFAAIKHKPVPEFNGTVCTGNPSSSLNKVVPINDIESGIDKDGHLDGGGGGDERGSAAAQRYAPVNQADSTPPIISRESSLNVVAAAGAVAASEETNGDRLFTEPLQ